MTGSLMRPVRHCVRLTLEALTPLSIASGEVDGDLDTLLFRDWNGLPCLAGAGLAGVLRSLSVDQLDPKETEELWGRTGAGPGDGRPSRISVSFGLAHDANDRPVDGDQPPVMDSVLKLLAKPAPVLRDHVRINADRGAAEDTGKFDRAACPRGTRFSLELTLDGESPDDGGQLLRVATLFSSPHARLGGATRRGYGKVRVVRGHYAAIDRFGPDGRRRWIAYRAARIDETPSDGGLIWRELDAVSEYLNATTGRGAIVGTLALKPKGFWRVGQGDVARSTGSKRPARMPLSEAVIVWEPIAEGVGEVARVDTTSFVPISGAGLKGVLAHRAEFHARRLMPDKPAEGRVTDVLFGQALDREEGKAGHVLVDDIYVDMSLKDAPVAARRTRNSIDRHTGGVRDGRLFTDEALWRGPTWTATITVLAGALATSPEFLQALDWAIEDLCQGRLAIGAGDGIGDGVFDESGSSIDWSGRGSSLVQAVAAVAP